MGNLEEGNGNGNDEVENKVMEKRIKKGDCLVIERTHEKPVTRVESFNIPLLREKISKFKAVRDLWQDKIDALEFIVFEFDGL